MIRLAVSALLLAAGITSCKKDILASAQWELPGSLWIVGDNKNMMINAPDSTEAYQMDIRIDHNDQYKYQNLYIRLSTTFPSGKKINSITSLELANLDGSWSGDCSGKNCSVTLPLQRGFTFPELGEYKLIIEPYMRIDTIAGLKEIAVTCRKRAK